MCVLPPFQEEMRTAGTVPARAKSAPASRMLAKQQEMLRRAPTTASRTSPSIPTPFHAYAAARTQSPRRGKAFIPELDRQARKDRNPRNFMEKGSYNPLGEGEGEGGGRERRGERVRAGARRLYQS